MVGVSVVRAADSLRPLLPRSLIGLLQPLRLLDKAVLRSGFDHGVTFAQFGACWAGMMAAQYIFCVTTSARGAQNGGRLRGNSGKPIAESGIDKAVNEAFRGESSMIRLLAVGAAAGALLVGSSAWAQAAAPGGAPGATGSTAAPGTTPGASAGAPGMASPGSTTTGAPNAGATSAGSMGVNSSVYPNSATGSSATGSAATGSAATGGTSTTGAAGTTGVTPGSTTTTPGATSSMPGTPSSSGSTATSPPH